MLGGGRWDHIINTICFYMKNLELKDLISGIVYDMKPVVIARQFGEEWGGGMVRAEMVQPAIQQQYPPPVYGYQYARLADPPRNQNKACACVCFLIILFIMGGLIVAFTA